MGNIIVPQERVSCKKCGAEISSPYCPWCGAKQTKDKRTKRGNGEGSVYKRGKTWSAAKVFGYSKDGKPIRTIKGGFATRKAALEHLKTVTEKPSHGKVKDIYDAWIEKHSARVVASTTDCYKAAAKYLSPLYDRYIDSVEVYEWQDLIDNCGHGRRTQENMRVVISKLYEYAIPRRMCRDVNLGKFLDVAGDSSRRDAFTPEEVEKIRQAVGVIPFADVIYCHCYLGYRTSEIISRAIEDYSAENGSIYGGIKTDKGRYRTVTISPKIAKIIEDKIGNRKEGYIFIKEDGKAYTSFSYNRAFKKAIEAIGIKKNGRKISPYSCRHTFASMVDKVVGGNAAKRDLIGHKSDEMLQYYQHSDIESLRKITDNI